MTVLAAEVESLKSRLQSSSDEKNDLQNQLNEALKSLTHSEQAMDAKLREHKDLLVQYGYDLFSIDYYRLCVYAR